ncbi:ABC transporter permease [Microbacterium betulae]|uniref:ABC transporter permease n=1 Tax=Microbacterium betulae TaxID=2981139 RepID=A0AA97FF09_9MICO|nr:ABC transporter permease [Microbacterium sp. AB]WOF22436.1 ABC transporter permease [Microbacterium sp. AB]
MIAAALDRGVAPRSSARARPSAHLGFLRERGMGASILVSALSAAFGVTLVTTTGYIGSILQNDPYLGESDTLAVVVAVLSILLTAVAMYVAAIVTANTFSTIVAGRIRRIALLRLIGASARSQRTEIGRQGLVIGALGALAGLAAGVALSYAGVALGDRLLGVAGNGYVVAQPVLAFPAAIVVLTTWAAAWAGSRRVLAVTPLQALGGSEERGHDVVSARPARNALALVLFAVGAVLLAVGVVAGLATPLGILPAFAGGLLSFTGLVSGATTIMPPVLRAIGRCFGRSATATLAAENALRHPERSSRMSIGVVMGVTLVTMFAVATETAKAVFTANAGGELPRELATVLDTFSYVMMGLVAVSAVIAAVGLVNLLTIGVVQRRRELGLLRALGLSSRQVRGMVLLEATHVTLASLVAGLVLGIAYGWAGAQSLLGSVPAAAEGPAGSLVSPAVPWGPVVAIVLAMAVLTIVAAVTPTRLATSVAPVEALAAD